jgi:hypothetical protein
MHKPKKQTLEKFRLFYEEAKFNKKEITQATLDYFRHPRWVRYLLMGNKWKRAIRQAHRIFNKRDMR